jgi:hypothetical protein
MAAISRISPTLPPASPPCRFPSIRIVSFSTGRFFRKNFLFFAPGKWTISGSGVIG